MGSAIEKSLRRALTKGSAADPDFRLQIYEAAERALLRLEADRETTAETKEEHRRDLIAAIESIESDFGDDDGEGSDRDQGSLDADAPTAVPSGRRSDEAAVESANSEAGSKPIAVPARGAAVTDFADRERMANDTEGSEDGDDGERRRKGSRAARMLVSAVIVLLLLFLLGAAVWIVLPFFSSGSESPSQQSQAAGEPGISVAEAIRENTDTVPVANAEPQWIDVYTPATLREFAGSDDAIVDVAEAGGQAALKLTAPSGVADGADGAGQSGSAKEVEMPISGDIARQFAGRKVDGEIVVGSPDGKPRTFTLRCLFGGETVCGRQRFTTALPEENFLFHLEFPPEAVTGGQIAIDPSVGSDGTDLMFFGLKLRNAA